MRKDITRTIASTIATVVELKEIEGTYKPVEMEELLPGKLSADQVKKALLKENKDRSIQIKTVEHVLSKYAMSKETFMQNAEKLDGVAVEDLETEEEF